VVGAAFTGSTEIERRTVTELLKNKKQNTTQKQKPTKNPHKATPQQATFP